MKLSKVLFTCAVGFIALAPAAGTNYSIDWHTISGGGGNSSSSTFEIDGTIGQVDAGLLTSSGYSLVGGFWSIFGCPPAPPGLPVLTVTLTSNQMVRIAWPCGTSSSFILQQCSDITSGAWSTVNQPIAEDNISKSITIMPVVGSLFFRLSASQP